MGNAMDAIKQNQGFCPPNANSQMDKIILNKQSNRIKQQNNKIKITDNIKHTKIVCSINCIVDEFFGF